MDMNIQLSKEQQQYLVLGVLVLGGGGYGYVKYFFMPTSEKIAETTKTIEQVERKIAKAKGQAGRLNKIKRELAELNEKAAEAEKQLPQDEDFTGIIEMVSALSRQYRFNLSSFSRASARNRKHFTETLYSISGAASFHDIGRFLAAISLQERIFNVRNVTVSGSEDGSASAVSFSLVSYRYKG